MRQPLGVLVGVSLLFFASEGSAQAPNIEVTYRLVSRTLANGTVLAPPNVMGVWTYANGYRTFNIIRKDASGKVTSRSLVSTYKMSANEYSESLVFHIRTDEIGGKPPM